MPSLARELINAFVEEIPEEKLTGLVGSNVMVENTHPMISRAVSTNGRFLRWQYRYHLEGSRANNYYGAGVHSGEMFFLGKDVKKASAGSTLLEYRQVFGYFPSVLVPKWGRFEAVDTVLDGVLEKGLAEFPSVKTKEDLSALTKWVHDTYPYQKPVTDVSFVESRRDFVSLGTQLENEIVCAQLALIELGILKLRGSSVVPLEVVPNPIPAGKSRHAVLSVKLPGHPKAPKLCVDPTAGTVLDLNYARYLYQVAGESLERAQLVLI